MFFIDYALLRSALREGKGPSEKRSSVGTGTLSGARDEFDIYSFIDAHEGGTGA